VRSGRLKSFLSVNSQCSRQVPFGFDPELLYLACHHGLHAVEIPVRWGHSPATKVSMLRDTI